MDLWKEWKGILHNQNDANRQGTARTLFPWPTTPWPARGGTPVVLAGDYHVMPTELDAARPKRWASDALFLPESRAAYRGLLELAPVA